MVDSLMHAYRDAISAYPDQLTSGDGHEVETIHKENLIVFDPDYHKDYPPSIAVHFAIPHGYRILCFCHKRILY
jgi:hypothetical protein